MKNSYLVQVAYIDAGSCKEVESNFIDPYFNVQFKEKLPTIRDCRRIGLSVRLPHVWRYFVRVEDVLKNFVAKKNYEALDIRNNSKDDRKDQELLSKLMV
ncbi:MAG: hypothetical protein ACUVTL_07680 [Thermoproteota archaeon]